MNTNENETLLRKKSNQKILIDEPVTDAYHSTTIGQEIDGDTPLSELEIVRKQIHEEVEQIREKHFEEDGLYQLKIPAMNRKINCLTTVRISVLVLIFVLLIGTIILIVELIEKFPFEFFAVGLNIHLRLSLQCQNTAIQMNQFLQQNDTNEQIDFSQLHIPHISLFLSEFDIKQIPSLMRAMNSTIYSWDNSILNCTIFLPDSISTSSDFTYAFWNVQNSACLQYISDSLVNATYSFVEPRAKVTVPAWVQNVADENLKARLLYNIQQYGSPSVFSEFSPHVTIGFDDEDPQALVTSISALYQSGLVSNCTFVPSIIGLSSSGEYGTVLNGRDWKLFLLPFGT